MTLQQEDPQLQPQQKYICSCMKKNTISTALHSPKSWERFADDSYFIFKRTYLENFFRYIDNLHQKVNFTIEEESNEGLAFFDTLSKENNGKVSVLVFTNQFLHYNFDQQTSCKESVISFFV